MKLHYLLWFAGGMASYYLNFGTVIEGNLFFFILNFLGGYIALLFTLSVMIFAMIANAGIGLAIIAFIVAILFFIGLKG